MEIGPRLGRRGRGRRPLFGVRDTGLGPRSPRLGRGASGGRRAGVLSGAAAGVIAFPHRLAI